MAKTDFKSVDEYIATHPENVRAILQRVRKTIRSAVPDAQEVISYQIPAYKLHGGAMLYFAGWKRHYSLYPATARVLAAFDKDLAAYEVSKGTIRFPLSQPVPVKLIGRIAKLRAQEAAERARTKRAASVMALARPGAGKRRPSTPRQPRPSKKGWDWRQPKPKLPRPQR